MHVARDALRYIAWDLADLNGNMISLFLFDEAAIYFALEMPPGVFALLNPEIIAQARPLFPSPVDQLP